MIRPFAEFGASHVAVFVLTLVLPLGAAILTRRFASAGLARAISHAFAALLIITWAVWYWLIAVRGWISPQTVLPLNLCDWATVAVVATLLKPNQRAYELAYFWALSGTLQALVTPELFYDFPDLRFIVFFAFHGGTIAAVLFLTFGLRLRPYPSSIPRILAWSLLYMALALAANGIFGTNFGYLSAKPAKPSLLDLLGPWPVYIVELAGIGILYALLLYAPFFVADRIRGRRPA